MEEMDNMELGNGEGKKEKKNTLESKTGMMQRLSTKITIMVSCVVLLAVAIQVISGVSKSSKAMTDTYLNYAMNLAESSASGVDFATTFGEEVYGGYTKNLASEAAVAINFSREFGEKSYMDFSRNLAEQAVAELSRTSADMNTVLSGINIRGVEGSYAYLVSPEGTMLWHPDSAKIGNPVENAAVKGIVEDLKAGKTVENGAVLYEYKGATKLAGYAFTAPGNILVVTADYDSFMKIDYDTLLGNIDISGVEGSYAYMVSPDGTMLWHPDSAKIGNPVENAAVKGIVADLQAGKTVEDGYCIYEYKGSKKLAGYSFTDQGNIILVTADYDKLIVIDYSQLIGDIEITGVEGSYAYMVSPDGTMLYHTDESKIGNPVENAAVKGIVADLQEGKKVENGFCTYEYKGADKVAGYAFTGDGNIVIVTADKKALMSDVKKMTTSMVLYGILCIIVAVIIAAILSSKLFDGVTKLVGVINKTAGLDLRLDPMVSKLAARTDEVGVMAKSVHNMREALRNIVESITNAGDSIDDNVGELQKIVENVDELCQDNSSTSEELAAGMETTTTTISNINGNANAVKDNADGIESMANQGLDNSKEILKRANDLADTTRQASERTRDMYESVKAKADKAIEASKAVKRIEELAQSIMTISSQTSLLSLNASIESARAGEAGRGFAVVASEISDLATQTSDTVKDISGIVSEVTDSVNMMAECLKEATSFLEQNVLSDYDEFGKVSEQYKKDANGFGDMMDNIKGSIHNLNEALSDIVVSIDGIDVTVGETASGVNDIAGKTTDMVDGVAISSDKVDECREAIKNLREIVDEFTK